MSRWWRLLALILLSSLAVAGCSSGGDGDADASEDTSAQEHDHDDHDHSHDEDDGEASERSEPPGSEVEVELDDGRTLRVALGKECLTPGEEQTITVDAWPDARLLYQAIYAGDRHGLTPDYPGGNDRGQTDAEGRYEGSWVVGENAPEGDALFELVVVGEQASALAGFNVAGSRDDCS